jgi:hypothetical protein
LGNNDILSVPLLAREQENEFPHSIPHSYPVLEKRRQNRFFSISQPPSLIQQPGFKQGDYHVDKAGTANAFGRRVSDHFQANIAAYHANGLNDTITGTHTVVDVRSFERRPCYRRAGKYPAFAGEDDFRIRADVHG